MKFEAATIKDIAKALGLSTSTVSRALRDSYEISAETKQTVLDYAKKINYSPNPVALSLRAGRTRSIGVIVTEIANSFFSQIIDGIESVANEKGYNVIITQSLDKYERELNSMQFLASRSVDGCLVSVSSETKDFNHFTDLYARGFPLICYDRIIAGLDTHKVIADNYQGAYKATKHLIDNGFKHIGVIASAERLSITKERLAGYIQALADNNIAFNEHLVKHCANGGRIYEEVEAAADTMLRNTERPDAVFTASDRITTNFLRYCKTHHLQIPMEVAVIGFSNLDITDIFTPSLSVVKQSAFDMGKTAAELLISMIESKRPVTTFEHKVIPAEIIVRESSCNLKNK